MEDKSAMIPPKFIGDWMKNGVSRKKISFWLNMDGSNKYKYDKE